MSVHNSRAKLENKAKGWIGKCTIGENFLVFVTNHFFMSTYHLPSTFLVLISSSSSTSPLP